MGRSLKQVLRRSSTIFKKKNSLSVATVKSKSSPALDNTNLESPLPWEIWIQILVQLPTPMIKQLSVVSKLFQRLSLELLFTEVVLSDKDDELKWRWFINATHIHPFIRSLSLEGSGFDDNRLGTFHWSALFPALTRLQRLELSRCAIPNFLSEFILSNPHLKHVGLSTCKTSSLSPAHVAGKDSIQSLTIRWADPSSGSIYRVLLETYFENLTTLTTDTYSLPAISALLDAPLVRLTNLCIKQTENKSFVIHYTHPSVKKLILNCPRLLVLNLEVPAPFFTAEDAAQAPLFLQSLTCTLPMAINLLPVFSSSLKRFRLIGYVLAAVLDDPQLDLVQDLIADCPGLTHLELLVGIRTWRRLFVNTVQSLPNLQSLKVEFFDPMALDSFMKNPLDQLRQTPSLTYFSICLHGKAIPIRFPTKLTGGILTEEITPTEYQVVPWLRRGFKVGGRLQEIDFGINIGCGLKNIHYKGERRLDKIHVFGNSYGQGEAREWSCGIW